METLIKYITAITNYYGLFSVTLGSEQTKKKKMNIQISKKISLCSLIVWWIISLFFIAFSMGNDRASIITISNKYGKTTYNKNWWVHIIVAIIIILITIVRSLFLFRKLEHKPVNLNIYKREKPSNLRPAHVRILLNDGLIDKVSLAATLLDLIDRGYLSIEKCEDMKKYIFKNRDIVLIKTEKKTDDLLKFEIFIIEWFINKYGDGKKVSMKEIENRLKNSMDEEKPSDLFENWMALVFLSFPLNKFYKKYHKKNKIYIILIMLGVLPILPYIRTARYIWSRVFVICISKIFTE